MASPILYARFEPRLFERVMAAAQASGSSLSAFLREAVEAKLGAIEQEAAERAALLKEARRFLAVPVGASPADRDAYSLVQRYVAALEATAGRLSAAEQRGRARALAEIAAGALEPLDGQEISFPAFEPGSPPLALETTEPRRRGFLKAALAAERARALLKAAPVIPEPPSAVEVLGEQRVRELWQQAIGWPGRVLVFCPTHGVVPSAPSEPGRCYLGCRVDDGPEAA